MQTIKTPSVMYGGVARCVAPESISLTAVRIFDGRMENFQVTFVRGQELQFLHKIVSADGLETFYVDDPDVSGEYMLCNVAPDAFKQI